MVTPKICLFCKNFHYFIGERDWSDVTPGCDSSMSCNYSHFLFRHYESELGDIMATAMKCPDYEIDSWAKYKFKLEG